MDVLTIVRVVAIGCAGLLAGTYFGYRTGAYHAVQELSASSFVQFQQVVHVRYVRFMPPLVLTGLLTTLAWLWLVSSPLWSAEFWLVAASSCGSVLIAVMTRVVNVPLNNRLMTFSISAPPSDLRAIWAPWDRVNTIRTILATGVLICEAAAVSLRAAP